MRGGWEAFLAVAQYKAQRDFRLTIGDWAIVAFILAVIGAPVIWKAMS